VLTLLAVLLVLRLREGPRDRDLAALGLVLGLGWWATPQVGFVAAPLLGWLVWRHRPVIRRAWVALGPALLGAAPWLVWSALHDWASLQEPFDDTGGYFDHLRTFVYATWPEALGLRAPFTLEWLPGELAGRALELAAVAALVWIAARRRRSLEPLVVVAAAYPFLQALSPLGSLNDEPRYLVLLLPFVTLLLSPLLAARQWTSWSAVAVAAASSTAGLISMGSAEPPVPPVGGVRVPADLAPALEVLKRFDERRVRANYAIAYRITFESDERIVAASTSQVRHRPYQRLVAGAQHPAVVFVADSDDDRRATARLRDAGYVRIRAGDWAVYVHRSRPTVAAPTVQSTSSGGTTLNRNRGCCGVTR
jgi:hypothetical protein